MIKSLKTKVLIGFMMPILFLIIAGGYSIFQFMELNKSADLLVDESYNTLSALKTMTESLQDENSAILLLIIGDWETGIYDLKAADSSFMAAFEKAERHTTIENKEIYLEKIVESYTAFKENWKFPIEKESGQENINWYHESVHKNLLDVIKNVNVFVEINEKYMYDEASIIKNNSKRAIIPGIVAIIAAVVYLLMLNFFITKFIISPIKRLSFSSRNYHFGSKSFDAKISSNDEIKDLEKSIRMMTDRVSNKMDN
jgi:CHASE3 domain sensor protein